MLTIRVGTARMIVTDVRTFMTEFRLLETIDAHVVEQLLVLVGPVQGRDTLQSFQHHLVRLQSGREVGQALLEIEQPEHLFVAQRALEFVFEVFDACVDLTQPPQRLPGMAAGPVGAGFDAAAGNPVRRQTGPLTLVRIH